MLNWPILSVIAFLPLAGAMLIAVMPSHGEAEQRNVRWIALWVTLVTFAIALLLTWRFDPKSADFQFEEKYRWLQGTIVYHMGVDGISLPFVVLTTGLMPISIIASWTSIPTRVKEYMIAFLVLPTLMVCTLPPLHLVLFSLFFSSV